MRLEPARLSDYATDWTSVKPKWEPTMTTAEVDSVTATLTTCEKRVSVVKEMGTAVQ